MCAPQHRDPAARGGGRPEGADRDDRFDPDLSVQAIAKLEGGADLLARIPQTAARRVHVPGAQLFLAYSTNTIEPGPEVVEFPLNSSCFRYEGFGIPVGEFTAEGPSLENFVTLTQVGSATITDARGDQLELDCAGTFTVDEATGGVDFSGTGEEIWYGVFATGN